MSTKSNKLYKACLTRILSDGSPDAGMVLCKDFYYKKAAIKAAERTGYHDEYILEIREYDARKSNVIAFGSLSDTGQVVYRDISGVKALFEEFGDIPMDPETECIESPWRKFPSGTHREEIWHWFEDTFHVSVAEDLLYA